MLGLRQQERARSLDTLQQTARALLDAAAGAANEDEDDDAGDESQQLADMAKPAMVEPTSATADDRWTMEAVTGD